MKGTIRSEKKKRRIKIGRKRKGAGEGEEEEQQQQQQQQQPYTTDSKLDFVRRERQGLRGDCSEDHCDVWDVAVLSHYPLSLL